MVCANKEFFVAHHLPCATKVQLFCGAPGGHAPLKLDILWRTLLHAPQKCGGLAISAKFCDACTLVRHRKTYLCGACWMCATEMWLSVVHVAYAPQKFEKIKKNPKILKKKKIQIISKNKKTKNPKKFKNFKKPKKIKKSKKYQNILNF